MQDPYIQTFRALSARLDELGAPLRYGLAYNTPSPAHEPSRELII